MRETFRKFSRHAVLAYLLCFSLVPIPVKAGTLPTGINVTGKWRSDFGTIVFRQSGNRIHGEYTHDRGRLEDILSGNEFIGKRFETFTYRPKHDGYSILT